MAQGTRTRARDRPNEASIRRAPPLAYRQSYRMLQYAFRVESDDRRVGDLVEEYLGWFRHEDGERVPIYALRRPNGGRGVLGYVNRRRFHQGISVGALLNRFLRRVNSEAIRSATDLLLVHAAAAS